MNASATVRPSKRKATIKNHKYYDDPEVLLMLRVKQDDAGCQSFRDSHAAHCPGPG